MPTMAYRLQDGTRVPGVTTILGRFKESGGLIHWSSRLAFVPLEQAKALAGSATQLTRFMTKLDLEACDYKKVRDKAADAGTAAHDMFECHLRKLPFDASPYPQPILDMASSAFDAAKKWADSTRFEVVETEKPLVSERYRFGGTRDACLVDGKRAIGDWKTSKDIYPEYLAQLAAYAILDEEHGATIDGGFHLLRFSKQDKPTDPVRFTHHYWSHLDAAREAFLLMRRLYDLMADLGKLAK